MITCHAAADDGKSLFCINNSANGHKLKKGTSSDIIEHDPHFGKSKKLKKT
jgi:hypothetical protein